MVGVAPGSDRQGLPLRDRRGHGTPRRSLRGTLVSVAAVRGHVARIERLQASAAYDAQKRARRTAFE
ncbi:toxin-antitoxin system, antitoxin component, ribbon-helix-helix domain protein [Streptomyces turgidiscabies Car8]|uniref:Toxin-antitoxin system, antitoxin component, ribbon-helix-helix domain protein n=1 Tax=Streptomyces turgidiscabies (strain Car8) TaxID=698760 RepID=L7FBL8_STRT8|nr:toxin-antitoxin system, antitoxin component, ribbon-helix-helix domain protein [Streptomyces turgidiscabies Car8]